MIAHPHKVDNRNTQIIKCKLWPLILKLHIFVTDCLIARVGYLHHNVMRLRLKPSPIAAIPADRSLPTGARLGRVPSPRRPPAVCTPFIPRTYASDGQVARCARRNARVRGCYRRPPDVSARGRQRRMGIAALGSTLTHVMSRAPAVGYGLAGTAERVLGGGN